MKIQQAPSDSSLSGIFVKYTSLISVLLRHIHTHKELSYFDLMYAFYCLNCILFCLNSQGDMQA